MLPRPRRVNHADDFRRVLRRGRKAGRRRLVVHVALPTVTAGPGAPAGPGEPAGGEPRPSRAGFVVGRAVGPSVVRHRVTRRLRHLLRGRLDLLPAGTDVVVRAQAPAAGASSQELADDLDAALRRLGLPVPGAASPRDAGRTDDADRDAGRSTDPDQGRNR